MLRAAAAGEGTDCASLVEARGGRIRVVEGDPRLEITVDLERREVRWAGQAAGFEIDDYTRWRLMEGLDDIGLTLRAADDIASYENGRQPWLPTTV